MIDNRKKNAQTNPQQQQQDNIKNLFQGTSTISIVNYLTLLFDLIISLSAIRFLTLQEIGVYNVIIQYFPILTILFLFGSRTTLSRKFTELKDSNPQQANQIIRFYISIAFTFSAIFGIIIIIFAESWSELLLLSKDFTSLMILVGINVFLFPNELLNHVYIIKQEYRQYLWINLAVSICRLVCFFLFIQLQSSVEAFFWANIISESVRMLIYSAQEWHSKELVGEKGTEQKKKDLERIKQKTGEKNKQSIISKKELLQYSFPIFLQQLLLILKNQIASLIFFYFSANLELMGALYYIRMIVNVILVVFNATNTQLTIFYNQERVPDTENLEQNHNEEHTDQEKEHFNNNPINKELKGEERHLDSLMKIFWVLAGIFGWFVIIFSVPIAIIIVRIFSLEVSDLDQNILIWTLISFGIYILLFGEYYIPPLLVALYRKSGIIFRVHFFSMFFYLLGYILFISLVGMPGIALGQTFGLGSYILLSRRYASDKISLPRLRVIAPLISIFTIQSVLAILNWFIWKDLWITSKWLILDQSISFLSILISSILYIISILGIFWTLRRINFFNENDNVFLTLFGKKISL